MKEILDDSNNEFNYEDIKIKNNILTKKNNVLSVLEYCAVNRHKLGRSYK